MVFAGMGSPGGSRGLGPHGAFPCGRQDRPEMEDGVYGYCDDV